MDDPLNTFPGLPPFPDHVPTAPLLRLSLKDLLAEDQTEIERLSKACEEIGFFYLDLRDAGSFTKILDYADELFEIGAGLFELPLEEKQKYDFSSQKSYFGYKAQGAAVVDRQGNLDRNEFYNVSKDDIMCISKPLPAPDIIKNNRDTYKSFIERSHAIVTLILNLLDKSLGLPQSTLANIHRLQAVSGDQVRFVKALPQPIDDRRTALGEHTDFGSVTVLFNRLGGLQVLPPGVDAEWQYIRPLPGHAIVNLGDAMVKFTNGLLRSNIHRVVSPPGEQADSTRYSLVYFSRPEDDVPLRRLEGSSRIPELEYGVEEEAINSKDWIIRRALGRRVDVPDIDYDKSAGTETLSRSTPRTTFETPPDSPLCAVDLGSPSRSAKRKSREAVISQDQTLAEIRARREIFFARISESIQPLLGDDAPRFPSTHGNTAYCHSPRLETQPAGQVLPETSDKDMANLRLYSIRATLKPYQLDGVSWLLDLQHNGVGGILADDMGLGKTLQALSLLQYTKNNASLDTRFLINDLTELWSILHWLYPEMFVASTAGNFQDAFSLSRGKFETEFLSHVTRFLKSVMLRRTKSSPEVGLKIPPKTETILSVPLTESQLEWYHRILTGVDQSVLLGDETSLLSLAGLTPRSQCFVDLTTDDWEGQEEANVKQRSQITTNTLMELRKCSIHPYLLADALPEPYRLGRHIVENSAKFILLRKMVHQFVIKEQKKVIIFSGFDQALNLCEDLLEMAKEHLPFKHVRLDGSTSSAWRNLSVFLFQNDERYKVFLLSIRAGGEGLNLVSSSTVIFLDDDWNPQVMRQAEARAHRIGQTQPVRIFRIHAKGTVEDQMRRRLAKKAYFADKVLGDLGRNVDHPIGLIGNETQEISLMPGRAIVPSSFHAADLESSEFESILASCALDEVNARDMSLEEKKAWLCRSERVKTNIFNGEKIETKSKAFSVYDETILGVSKTSRRIGKSRVVMIGEWEVSKESLSCASSPTSPTFPNGANVAKARKVNDATIICPHHYCCNCGKTASEAGRLLLSCLKCPRAYCEGCLDWSRTVFVGENTDAEARGHYPRNAFFIECAKCRDNSGKRGLEELPALSDKRRRR
ncbi:putative oxidoreductase, 2OG-Fe(II) oxygenase family [Aspergillus stella-maris]|uniref:putative oxidoreductase, 2OG-Fe(II) oxygenase family n=1 Tax=Aspergillus stella-maris TaxID=1810926 RepID=UPI003CCD5D9E